MRSVNARISHIEKSIQGQKQPDAFLIIAVPDDYPDPLPPNTCRMKDVDKIDTRGCRSVLVICSDPRRAAMKRDCDQETQSMGGRTVEDLSGARQGPFPDK